MPRFILAVGRPTAPMLESDFDLNAIGTRKTMPCCGRNCASRMPAWPAFQPITAPSTVPPERLAILELKAARGWSLEQTAKRFFACPKTITSWMKRLDEDGAAALVQLPVPVNKFPDFIRYAVQRLQTLCPNLGKKKLSEVLARAGLHLGTTTIGRIRKEKPGTDTTPARKT